MNSVQLSTASISVNKMVNVGDRKEPSKKAVDQFIKIYLEIAQKLKDQQKF